MAREIREDHFLVTCTSSECKEFYPENKASHFKTRLIETLNLKNDGQSWEAGLAALIYSRRINNVGQCLLMTIYCWDGYNIHEIPVTDGLVKNAKALVNYLNHSVAKYRFDVQMGIEQFKQAYHYQIVNVDDSEGQYVETPITKLPQSDESSSPLNAHDFPQSDEPIKVSDEPSLPLDVHDFEQLVTGIIHLASQKFLAFMVTVKEMIPRLKSGVITDEEEMYFFGVASLMLAKMDDTWTYLQYFVREQRSFTWKNVVLMTNIENSVNFTEYALEFGHMCLRDAVKLVVETFHGILFTWVKELKFTSELRGRMYRAIRDTSGWYNIYIQVNAGLDKYGEQAEDNFNFMFSVSNRFKAMAENIKMSTVKKDTMKSFHVSYLNTMVGWFKFLRDTIVSKCSLTPSGENVDCQDWYVYQTIFDLWTLMFQMDELAKAHGLNIYSILSESKFDSSSFQSDEDERVTFDKLTTKLNGKMVEIYDQLIMDGMMGQNEKPVMKKWLNPAENLELSEFSNDQEFQQYDELNKWSENFLLKHGKHKAVEKLREKQKDWIKGGLARKLRTIKDFLGEKLLKRYQLSDKNIVKELEAGGSIEDVLKGAVKGYVKPAQPKFSEPLPQPLQTVTDEVKQDETVNFVKPKTSVRTNEPSQSNQGSKRSHDSSVEDTWLPIKRLNGFSFRMNEDRQLSFISKNDDINTHQQISKILEQKEQLVEIDYDVQSDRPPSIIDVPQNEAPLDEADQKAFLNAHEFSESQSMMNLIDESAKPIWYDKITLHPFLYNMKIVTHKPPKLYERELEKDAIKFEYDETSGKVKIVTLSCVFDFAFSPTLLKMLGFNHEDSWIYSLSSLNKRIQYREFLDEMSSLDSSSPALTWKKLYETIKFESNGKSMKDFLDDDSKDNESFYRTSLQSDEKAFSSAVRKVFKKYQKNAKYWTTEFIPKQFYEFVLKEMNGNGSIVMMNAIITILFKQTPFPSYLPKGDLNIQTVGCFFVNSNIIEPEYINNDRLRILDIVPCRLYDEKTSVIEKYEPASIHYKPVTSVKLSDIEISLTTTLGEPVPFREGPVIAILNFRKVSR